MLSNRLFGPSGTPAAAGSQPAINTSGATAPAPLPAKQTITVNTETVIVNPAISTQALILSLPSGPQSLEQLPFDLIASGYLNLGTSSTVTIKLYSGSSLTVGSDTLLKSSGAVSAFSGKTNWWLKARLIYDSVSGTLTGSVEFLVNNTVVAAAALTNVPTGLSNTGNPVVSFVLSFTFGTAGTQIVNVQEFAIFG